jgi:hypothetical protein
MLKEVITINITCNERLFFREAFNLTKMPLQQTIHLIKKAKDPTNTTEYQ